MHRLKYNTSLADKTDAISIKNIVLKVEIFEIDLCRKMTTTTVFATK